MQKGVCKERKGLEGEGFQETGGDWEQDSEAGHGDHRQGAKEGRASTTEFVKAQGCRRSWRIRSDA